MPKAGDSLDSDFGTMADGPLPEDLGQSLVFTNSHHNGRIATHSYAHATANSYAHAASSGGSATYAHAALVHPPIVINKPIAFDDDYIISIHQTHFFMCWFCVFS